MTLVDKLRIAAYALLLSLLGPVVLGLTCELVHDCTEGRR